MEATKATNSLLNRFERQLETIKASVRIEDVAAEYGEFKSLGSGRLLGRCLSEEHIDKTASFTIFTDTQRFKCFGIGCQLSGDVIDLEKLAGKHDQLWTAMP